MNSSSSFPWINSWRSPVLSPCLRHVTSYTEFLEFNLLGLCERKLQIKLPEFGQLDFSWWTQASRQATRIEVTWLIRTRLKAAHTPRIYLALDEDGSKPEGEQPIHFAVKATRFRRCIYTLAERAALTDELQSVSHVLTRRVFRICWDSNGGYWCAARGVNASYRE